MRELDRLCIQKYGIPGIILMEHAGYEIAQDLINKFSEKRFLIFCGKGNNGGDGFVIARHLLNAQIPVKIVTTAGAHEIRGDALANYEIVRKLEVPMTHYDEGINLPSLLESADILIDALLGSGLQSDVRSPYKELIDAINAANKTVFAVDLPSGLCGDTGKPLGHAVKAAKTYTLGAHKQGMLIPDAAEYTGEIILIDIGFPPQIKALIGSNP